MSKKRRDRCPTPWKDRLGRDAAIERAQHLNRKVPNTVAAYACADHWHVGNPRAFHPGRSRR